MEYKTDIKKATKFVILIGIISLFADMTYEAARSINGPYLDVLGASATTVGWVAGVGELLGYGLRILTGYISDKTRRYWVIMIIGFALNLFSVPLLAIAGLWQLACIFIITERIGKAIRTPARDTVLSYGTHKLGRGWGFGLHEALDQTGATIGALLVSLVLFLSGHSYHNAYLVLVFPAIAAIIVLLTARSIYPSPEKFESGATTVLVTKGYPKLFWVYIAAAACIAAGYADFSLIAYHFKKTSLLKDEWIPVCYAGAMLSEALAALVLGKLFDKIGVKTMIVAIVVSLLFAPFVFYGGMWMAVAGMLLWGIGMGAQESVLKAAIANLIPFHKRGVAFGVFNTAFGISWFIGSVIMGRLYDISIDYLVTFSIALQLGAIAVFAVAVKNSRAAAVIYNT